MKSLFLYIKQLFKPSFTPSDEDLQVLEKQSVNENEDFTYFEDTTKVSKKNIAPHNIHLTTLLTIYKEVELLLEEDLAINTDEDPNLRYKKYYLNSATYNNLTNQSSKVRISFLFFLLEIVNNTPKNTITHFHDFFLANLFNSILERDLNFSASDFDAFFFFVNKNWTYVEDTKNIYGRRYSSLTADKCVIYFNIDYSLLIEKSRQYSFKKSLNKKVIAYLKEKHITRVHPSVIQFNYTPTAYRILQNNKYLENKSPFFLLPDNFGKNVNKLLVNTDENTVLFSELLQLFAEKLRVEKEIDAIVPKIDPDFFITTSLKIIDYAVRFKPHLRLMEKSKYYQSLFDENIEIIYELINTLERLSLSKKITSDDLFIIIKRSYSLKEGAIGLGKGTVKIGNLCIQLLANNYGKKGITILKKLHTETSYKRLKKKIDTTINILNT